MECGVEDYACHVLTWVKDNELIAAGLTKFFAQFGEQASGLVGSLAAFLKEHAEKIFGLLGASYGIVRWWRYREQILHKRLSEYLAEHDQRLVTGLEDVLQAIQRSSPGQPQLLPLFAERELCSVLRERNWQSPSAMNVQASANSQLRSAIDKIERRLEAGDKMVASLRNQLATAHILRGAISASASARAEENDAAALFHFRRALKVPGHDNSIFAKEFEAHQLRRLGRSDDAKNAYKDLVALASLLPDQKSQKIATARAKRYLAELEQADRIQAFKDGRRPGDGCAVAAQLLAAAQSDRAPFAPYRNWDLIEQAEIHYVSALVAQKLGRNNIESGQLDDAEGAYKTILQRRRKRLLTPKLDKKLLDAAEAGLERVARARLGVYDEAWLCKS